MSRSRPRHPMYDALLDAGRAEVPDDDRVEQIYQRTAAAVAAATVATATTAAAVSTATTSTAVTTGAATAPTATGLATGASAVGTGATTMTVGTAAGSGATATLGTAAWAKLTVSGVLLAAAATAITVPLVSEERDRVVDVAEGPATDAVPAEPEAEDPSRTVAASSGEEPEVAQSVTVRVETEAATVAEASDPATRLGVGLLREARQALAADPQRALELVGEHRRAHPAALSEERDFIVVRAHVALGETEAAREKAEAFRGRYPNSAYLTQMDSLLSH